MHAELSSPEGLRAGARASRQLELSLVNLLPDAQPSTVPGGSRGLGKVLDGGPSVVRRVDELIRARIGAALSVDQLASHAGVSARTLFRTYRRYRGCTPIQALREARLDQARRELLATCSDSSVTDTAVRCGFTHLGRFSQAYKKAFGESPSETLRRAKEFSERAG